MQRSFQFSPTKNPAEDGLLLFGFSLLILVCEKNQTQQKHMLKTEFTSA